MFGATLRQQEPRTALFIGTLAACLGVGEPAPQDRFGSTTPTRWRLGRHSFASRPAGLGHGSCGAWASGVRSGSARRMCRHDTRTTAPSPGLEKTDLRADRRFRVVTPAPKRDAAPAEWIGIGVGVPEPGCAAGRSRRGPFGPDRQHQGTTRRIRRSGSPADQLSPRPRQVREMQLPALNGSSPEDENGRPDHEEHHGEEEGVPGHQLKRVEMEI